jgi:hypothetical protein
VVGERNGLVAPPSGDQGYPGPDRNEAKGTKNRYVV